MKSLELNHDLFHILKRIFWFSEKKKNNLECRWRWKVSGVRTHRKNNLMTVVLAHVRDDSSLE